MTETYFTSAPNGQWQPPFTPATPVFNLPNNTFVPVQTVTITGQTDDPLPPFGSYFTSHTYGTAPPIQGPVWYFGYNVAPVMGGADNAHASAVISVFADAGDTNVGGAHGLEINLSFFTHDQSKATAAFQMVAVDDSSNSVTTTLRCGTGNSSVLNFTNADASTTFMTFSQAAQTGTIQVPMTITTNAAPATNTSLLIAAAGVGSTAKFTIQGNNVGAIQGQLFFAGPSNAWALVHTGTSFTITDVVNSRTAVLFQPGTQTTAYMLVNSALVIGNTALATTATEGFLNIPTMPGPPTGVPVNHVGTTGIVYDSTDDKLYAYNRITSAWKSVQLA